MKNKGFSLVELIVVIAIMAILVGVAVPVYTSYIEKANAAKDEQLLGEINSAFAIVLASNAIDINTVTEADIPVANGVVNLAGMTVNGAENADIENAMISILGTDLEFAVIEDIFYNATTHKFEDNANIELTYGGSTITLRAEDVAALMNSTFGEKIGIEGLLEKLGDVTGYAAAINSSALDTVMNSDGFRKSAAAALGIDSSDPGYLVELNSRLEALAAELIAKNPGLTQEQAIAQVQTNAAVLYAAQNSTTMETADITNWLSNDGARAEIIANLNNDATKGTALSQAALAYGMYTSYANWKGDSTLIGKTDDPLAVLEGLDDDGFQAYMASPQGQKDLEGYLSAMNMINGVTGDPEAVSKLMVNGYTDDEFKGALNGAIGN